MHFAQWRMCGHHWSVGLAQCTFLSRRVHHNAFCSESESQWDSRNAFCLMADQRASQWDFAQSEHHSGTRTMHVAYWQMCVHYSGTLHNALCLVAECIAVGSRNALCLVAECITAGLAQCTLLRLCARASLCITLHRECITMGLTQCTLLRECITCRTCKCTLLSARVHHSWTRTMHFAQQQMCGHHCGTCTMYFSQWQNAPQWDLHNALCLESASQWDLHNVLFLVAECITVGLALWTFLSESASQWDLDKALCLVAECITGGLAQCILLRE